MMEYRKTLVYVDSERGPGGGLDASDVCGSIEIFISWASAGCMNNHHEGN